MQGKIIIRCPPMSIVATIKPWIRKCQMLRCLNNEIILDDGTQIPFIINFQKALARWQSPGRWLVDRVVAGGETIDYGLISIIMDKELVIRTSWRTLEAQPCKASGIVYLLGRICKINMLFPKCTVTASGLGLFKYVAEPVVAEGTIEDHI